MGKIFPGVYSETGILTKVVVHTPNHEWDFVPCGPGAFDRYLIEDIFVLLDAQEEHSYLTRVLGLFIGSENVLQLETLLSQVCASAPLRKRLVAAVAALESLGLETTRELGRIQSAKKLARALICGCTRVETERCNYENKFPPIPNLMFTRDLTVGIPGGYVLSHAAMPGRRRETLLMKYILEHPVFQGAGIADVRDFSNAIFWSDLKGGLPASVEGGDIIVIDDRTLMVGTGERTTEPALVLLMKALLKINSPVRQVINVVLPEERSTMHLDTVFTMISRNEYMGYLSVLRDCDYFVYKHPYQKKKDRIGPISFAEALKKTGLAKLRGLKCGGSSMLYQSREQWTDGANLLAIAPSVLVGYDRNTETIRTLQDNGYLYLKSSDEMQEIARFAKDFRDGRLKTKLIMGIPGTELSRARGGPHCMTMPLLRLPLT